MVAASNEEPSWSDLRNANYVAKVYRLTQIRHPIAYRIAYAKSLHPTYDKLSPFLKHWWFIPSTLS